MTPIQMGRDPIKIRSRWCLLTGGQLNNFKKVRAHTESNFNIVFIKQTSTGFKDTHNTASRSVVRTLVTLMSWAHVQHIQTPTFLQLFTLYLLIFKPTSCTYHILHISHPAGEMQQRILLFTREMPSNHVCTTCKRCTCSINCYVSVFTLDALHSTCDQSENQSNKGISHVRGCQRGGRHSRVLFCQVKYI